METVMETERIIFIRPHVQYIQDMIEVLNNREVSTFISNTPFYLTEEAVPVRRYSDFTFPAGVYNTLRIDIGKADGQNWWCVMYPPLCLSAATGDVYAETAVFKEHGFTDKQIKELKQPKKKIKFAFWEWLFK